LFHTSPCNTWNVLFHTPNVLSITLRVAMWDTLYLSSASDPVKVIGVQWIYILEAKKRF